MRIDVDSKPLGLNPIARLQKDDVRGVMSLLLPEKVVELNETAAQILSLANGKRCAAEIIVHLSNLYEGETVPADADEFIRQAVRNKWLIQSVAAIEPEDHE